MDVRLLGYDDIWYKVLGFLSATDIYSVGKTCTYFDKLLNRESIWKAAYRKLLVTSKETGLLTRKKREAEQRGRKLNSRQLVHELLDQRLYILGSLEINRGDKVPGKALLYTIPTLLPQLADFPVRRIGSILLDGTILLILLTFEGDIYVLREQSGKVSLKKALVETVAVSPKFIDMTSSKKNFLLLYDNKDYQWVCQSSVDDVRWGNDGTPYFTTRERNDTYVQQWLCTDNYYVVLADNYMSAYSTSKLPRGDSPFNTGLVTDMAGSDKGRLLYLREDGAIESCMLSDKNVSDPDAPFIVNFHTQTASNFDASVIMRFETGPFQKEWGQ